GPVTTLAGPAIPGALTVVLTSTAGIGAGTVLATGDETIREHLVVHGPGAGPGEVRLRTPIVRSAPVGAAITSFGAAVPGPAPALPRAARAGDGVLMLDALPAALASAAAIQITDGANSEVRASHAVSDASGHFRLPGVRNLAVLELTATGPAG